MNKLKSIEYVSAFDRIIYFNIQYVIERLRSSGLRRLFQLSETSSIESLNIGNFLTEEIRHKVLLCSFCSQWNLLPKSKSGRPKKLSKRDERILLDLQNLRTELSSFSSNKTVSHCTIRRLLVRHNLTGPAEENHTKYQSKAKQIEMVQTKKKVWSQLLEAVCVYRRVQILVLQRRSGLGPQKSE